MNVFVKASPENDPEVTASLQLYGDDERKMDKREYMCIQCNKPVYEVMRSQKS